MAEPCPPICERQAAAQLLGPLRPNAVICAHQVRRTRNDLWPPTPEELPHD